MRRRSCQGGLSNRLTLLTPTSPDFSSQFLQYDGRSLTVGHFHFSLQTFPLTSLPPSVIFFLPLFLKDACKMKGCSPRPRLITVFRACENLAAPQLFRERGEKERREIALGIIVLRTNLAIHTWH